MLFIRVPAFSNTELVLDSASCGDPVYLCAPGSPPSPASKWVHPGYSSDVRKQICCVAKARGLISRRSASQQSEGGGGGGDLMTELCQLASCWDLDAYSLDEGVLCEELSVRGPVMGALYVTDELVAHISGLIGGSVSEMCVYSPPPAGGGCTAGLVSVVAVGVGGGGEIEVSLPWGTFPESVGGWNGNIMVRPACLHNLCSLASHSTVSVSRSAEHSVAVRAMKPGWRPVTTRPLPPAQVAAPRVVGKTRELKRTVVTTTPTPATAARPARRRHHALLAWFSKEEHVSLLLEGVVTATVVVLAVMVMVSLKTRRH